MHNYYDKTHWRAKVAYDIVYGRQHCILTSTESIKQVQIEQEKAFPADYIWSDIVQIHLQTHKKANTKTNMQMSKNGLSVEQVWMWPPTQLHFAVTSDSARWDNVRLMGQKQDKYLLFCSGCLPSKSLHYVTSLLICGEKKNMPSMVDRFLYWCWWWEGNDFRYIYYNKLQYSHIFCTKLNLMFFVSLT